MIKTIINLAELSEGQNATIRDIDVNSSLSRRLLDLGFVPGTPIRAITRAPLGDPTTYELRGYQLGLRRSESSLISVELNK